MMARRYGVFAAATGILGCALGAAPANATMTIDGNLSDWGVVVVDTPATGGCSNTSSTNAAICHSTDYSPVGAVGVGQTLAGGGKLLGYTVQDGNDTSNNYGNAPGYLAPLYGGQNYDAEFLGIAQQNGKLYVTIVTGHRPDDGSTQWGPGDLRMAISSAGGPANGTYGVELGGGTATSATSGTAITTIGGNGSTYSMNSQGYTSGVTSLAGQTVGSIWKQGASVNGTTGTMFLPGAEGTEATQIDQNHHGSSAGMIDAIYETRNDYGKQHNIIELQIDIASLLQTADNNLWTAYSLNLEWGPDCGNDLILSGVQFSSNDIPEPASLSILLMGLGAAVWKRRRKAA
jgi:hypothetical protein